MEKTLKQVVRVVSDESGALEKSDGGVTWYQKARQMRRHPTLAMARALAVAPALASPWVVETTPEAPEGAADEIDRQMQPNRLHLLRSSMLGCIDYGWQPYEKVFSVDSTSGMMEIKKFKPLLHDITTVLVDRHGRFNGLENDSTSFSQPVTLTTEEALSVTCDSEAGDFYGEALLGNAELSYDEWCSINAAAGRYDKKVAGAHWVVHYPLGTSTYNGVENTSNDVIADAVLASLEASGKIKVPRFLEALSEDLNSQTPDAWKIELLSDSSSARTAFVPRMKYLDAMMARSLHLPERSVLEGEFGTKAESGVQLDFAITNIELRHQLLIQILNWHVVNQLLRINYGSRYENTVYLSPTPLSDYTRSLLSQVYLAVLGNPQSLLEETDRIDLSALREKLGIPTVEVDDETSIAELLRDAAGEDEDDDDVTEPAET